VAQHSAHEGEGRESVTETTIDFSKIKSFFSLKNLKRNTALLTVILILIPVILTVYIRVQPQYLPQTDIWAENSVNNYFRNQIAQAINAQYPNLPQQNKETLINQQFEEFRKNNKEMLAQQVKTTSDYFKAGFQYQENNYTYTFLGDLDSYYYLRYARNLEEKGSYCDEIKGGECWDNHMYAPLGNVIGKVMHPYGIVYLYKFLHLLDSRVNLMQTSFFLPTFLAVIAAIAAFFVGKKIMNTTAGFFASMILALSPMFISRTLGSDTDIWNIMFPLIIVWVFLEAFEAKSLRTKIILSAVVGLTMGIFSFAWGGWWYIFDFILFTLIIYLGFSLIRNFIAHKQLKKIISPEARSTAIILVIIFISSAVFVSLCLTPSSFRAAFTEPFSRFATAKAAARENYWPNILTTVAEMNEAGIETIISQTAFGINLFFVISLLGIVFTLVRKKPVLKEYLIIAASALIFIFLVSRTAFGYNSYTYLVIMILPIVVLLLFLLFEKESAVDIKPAILLTVWFVGMIMASTKGVRFILLVIPAFSIAFGIAIGYLHQYLSKMLKEEFKISESITKPAIFILLCFLLVTPVRAGISTGNSFTPSMTSGWWETLEKIRTESQPDAIINSWWDFGHWFKYVADRRVTVDGAGQHYQLAHWMGTVLVNNDEEKAVHILRMLDCGSFQSYETLYAETNDVLFSLDLLKQVILQDKEDARKTLEKAGISKETIDKTLDYAFCKPPENYLITSEDMVGKAGVWAHFGLWDFKKAYMIREVKPAGAEEGIRILKEKFNYSEDEATNLYYELQALDSDRAMNDWISPWPNYLIGDWSPCSLEKTEPNKEESNLTNTTTNITSAEQEDAGRIICPIGREINRNEQARVVIDGAVLDLGDYKNSSLVVSSYDLTSGYKVGTGKTIPSAFVLFKEEGIERVELENATFPYDVLIDMVENRSMMCDPHLSESLFTKLFYLDGRYTKQFEKFSELTDMTGARISVWKVKWDPQFFD